MPPFAQYRYKSLFKRAGIYTLDQLSWFLKPFVAPSRAWNPSLIRKILVIRTDQMGDILMAFPALTALRNSFPEAQIDILTSAESAPLLRRWPLINKVIPWKHSWFSNSRKSDQVRESKEFVRQIKEDRYDLGIDFRGDLRHIGMMLMAKIPYRLGYGITGGKYLLTHCPAYPFQKHQILCNFHLLEAIGICASTQTAPLAFNFTEPERKSFSSKIPAQWKSEPQKIIVFHPSAGCRSKIWPMGFSKELMQRILDEKIGKMILIGTRDERALNDFSNFSPEGCLDLRGQTSIEELPLLLTESDLFLGHDSGPSHLAALMGVPSVVLFSGANRPEIWRPWSNQTTLITETVACSPCESKVCLFSHHDCMQKISPKRVFQTVVKKLSENKINMRVHP